jgi:hypothetical protein
VLVIFGVCVTDGSKRALNSTSGNMIAVTYGSHIQRNELSHKDVTHGHCVSHMDIVCHICLSHSEVVCHIENPFPAGISDS